MKRLVIVGCVSTAMSLASGCATKSYVRQQVQPIIAKVNELDQRTADNTRQINSTDAHIQQELETLNAGIDATDNKINDANTRAQQAQETASSAQTKATSLSEMVGKLDTYHVVSQVTVQFRFGEAQLDSKAKQELDQFSSQFSAADNYIVVIEGRTDAVGGDAYNNDLSESRANQVVRYLVSNHDLRPFQVHAIGLGKARPVASNETTDGRRANRRVDVKLMSSTIAPAEGNTANQGDSDDEEGLARPPKHY